MMRKWKQLAAAALVSALAVGCGDTCADLQEVCNFCEDPNLKVACEASVDADDGDRCDRDVSSYCPICGRRGTAVLEVCR